MRRLSGEAGRLIRLLSVITILAVAPTFLMGMGDTFPCGPEGCEDGGCAPAGQGSLLMCVYGDSNQASGKQCDGGSTGSCQTCDPTPGYICFPDEYPNNDHDGYRQFP